MNKLNAGVLIAAGAVFLAVVVTVTSIANASRNSSGTYSLPNTFTAGTVISSSSVNSNFSDIGTEITNSVDKGGRTVMTAQLPLYNGTVTSPSFGFASETGSGIYRIGANNPGFAVNGSKRQEWSTTGTTVTGTLAVSGASTLTGIVGIGGAATNTLDVTVAGSASTLGATILEPSLSDGNILQLYLGKSATAGGAGLLTYTKNATAANSTWCLGVFSGSASTFCVDGNNKAYSNGTLTIGSSGTAITASYSGSASLTPGAVSANTCDTASTITVTGAVAGDQCIIGQPSVSASFPVTCGVTANDTVAVVFCNPYTVSKTPTSGTYKVRVFR